MLDKLPHALHLGVLIVLLQNGIKLFVFGRRKLHGRSPLSAVRAAKNDQERSCTGLELPKFSACEGFSRFRVRSTRYCLPSPSSSSWLCVGRHLIRVPLDQEEVLGFHTVVQPHAVGAQKVVEVVHLFAVRQAEALLGIQVLRLHLEHLDHLNGALQIFVLGNGFVRPGPAGEKSLHQKVAHLDARQSGIIHNHWSFLLPVCFR